MLVIFLKQQKAKVLKQDFKTYHFRTIQMRSQNLQKRKQETLVTFLKKKAKVSKGFETYYF
jgi:hypothetical protein